MSIAEAPFAAAFTLWGSPVTWVEVAAFALSLAMVAANMRVNPVGWPLAIVASLLYAALFADSRLYGEAALQFVFVAASLWGWWQWLRGRGDNGAALAVHRLSRRGLAWTAGGIAVAWPLAGLVLRRATDSDVPFLDALATTGSVAGQVLLGRKVLENWHVWLAVNVFSVGLFASKALWLTSLLYALFALLSVAGWLAWLRRMRLAEAGAAEADSAGAATAVAPSAATAARDAAAKT
ncbi:MAG: nicotinamide mononucleotide transporter [Rubrivivax sp.]|nr:nicotinamide mononucleotide transporter [Rubrivivax sp.]